MIVTALDRQWVRDAAAAVTGFGTSVIGCGIEIAVERWLAPEQTPDGRPGVAILGFAVSGKELAKQIPRRIGQCLLTCPTTAVFAGVDESAGPPERFSKRVPMGETVRYFGDGHQISKVTGGVRYWRIPVMDGEFLCQHDVARVDGIGGGNFLLLGRDIQAITIGCRAAIEAMNEVDGIITPFPGGAARSGSKVGSKYAALFASTNHEFCPVLRSSGPTLLRDDEHAVLEIVIDGISADAIAHSMKVGITAACDAAGDQGLLRITAGNYGGKLGRHHFHLHEVMA